MESMGVASGCGCKEIYRFPRSYYFSLLLLYLFTMRRPLPLLSFKGKQEKPISSRPRGLTSRVNGIVMARIVVPKQVILDPLQGN